MSTKEEIWVNWLGSLQSGGNIDMTVPEALDFNEVLRLIQKNKKITLQSHSVGSRNIKYTIKGKIQK